MRRIARPAVTSPDWPVLASLGVARSGLASPVRASGRSAGIARARLASHRPAGRHIARLAGPRPLSLVVAWRPRLGWGSLLPALAAAAARRRPPLGVASAPASCPRFEWGSWIPALAAAARHRPWLGARVGSRLASSPRVGFLAHRACCRCRCCPSPPLASGPRRLPLGVLASGGVLGSPRSLLLLPVAVLGLGLAPASASCPCLWFGSWVPALAAAAVICINKHEISSSE